MDKPNIPKRSTVYLKKEDRERLEQLQAIYRLRGFEVSLSSIVRMLVIDALKKEIGDE